MTEKAAKHKNSLEGLPFPPLQRLDTDTPVTEEQVSSLLDHSPKGVSVCVRSVTGHQNRGGYFFHFRVLATDPHRVEILNFERLVAASIEREKLARFINHCSGLQFDQEMFEVCQSVINFRLDPLKSPEKQEEA
jgi:hypothetical protein